jgi:hypothetical protein
VQKFSKNQRPSVFVIQRQAASWKSSPKSANFGPVKGLKKIKEHKEIKISQKNPKR